MVFLEVMFSRSRIIAYEELEGLLDPKINSRHLKEKLGDFLCFTYGFTILVANGKFLPKTALTLGKMYRIDKSMLISAIATLISYGIVLGTLGSVQSSDDEN
ncbi:hypothetical protein CEXT_219781 [Caerostris extrusa]|uniref:Uncharacterized protein n=1 Tax=Caerostris extrusa TaxID=172846 RepID=A0AAV4QNP7_CAEEX|nr:hypothetical protein CEXT_219781 [Caerostris extrusa]